jgi:hypothetical protein
MYTQDHSRQEAILQGLPVRIRHYKVGAGFMTEIEADSDDHLTARGIAKTAEKSLGNAIDSFSKRVMYSRSFELTIGG